MSAGAQSVHPFYLIIGLDGGSGLSSPARGNTGMYLYAPCITSQKVKPRKTRLGKLNRLNENGTTRMSCWARLNLIFGLIRSV